MARVIDRLLMRYKDQEPSVKDGLNLFTEEEVSFFTELGLGDLLATLPTNEFE